MSISVAAMVTQTPQKCVGGMDEEPSLHLTSTMGKGTRLEFIQHGHWVEATPPPHAGIIIIIIMHYSFYIYIILTGGFVRGCRTHEQRLTQCLYIS